MKKEKNNIMLGCWGIGGFLDMHADYLLPVRHGPFKGFSIPSSTQNSMSRLALSERLPPLSRTARDGVDFMPFILYDKVTIDKVAFENLLNPRRVFLRNWKPSAQSKKILEKLASDNIILIENYASHLDNPEIKRLIDEVILHDLSDPSIVIPTSKSLSLWMKFYKNLLQMDESSLMSFHTMKNSLKEGDKSVVFGYVYECISDVNRMLILSQQMKQPIYEWESYHTFYNYKFKRVAKSIPSKTEGDTLKKLFNVFIPNFEITSYSQLQEIRQDNRLESVRSLVHRNNITIDKDLVIKAYNDVIKIKDKIESYSKYIGWAGYTLSILPGIVGTAIQQIANTIIKSNLENKIKWQLFFVEQAIEYDKKHIKNSIKDIKNKN